MKAIQFSKFGGPEVLELVELPDPHPAAGQIRVAVRAVGVNPIDWKVRSGAMGGELPATTGQEVAGTVDELGDGVADVAVGDEVFGGSLDGGGAAQFARHVLKVGTHFGEIGDLVIYVVSQFRPPQHKGRRRPRR